MCAYKCTFVYKYKWVSWIFMTANRSKPVPETFGFGVGGVVD